MYGGIFYPISWPLRTLWAILHSCHCTSMPMTSMYKEKLWHGILSPVEKNNKLHDMSDLNGNFQKIMSIFVNSHLKRQQIRSIYHIKTIFVLDSIDFKSYVSPCTSFQKISCCQLPHCDWLREVLTANHSQRRHSRCMLIMRLHKCTWRSAWI